MPKVDAQQMRTAANDALYWIIEVMRGSDDRTLYAQAVMEKAREHIQRIALMLHNALEGGGRASDLQEQPGTGRKGEA